MAVNQPRTMPSGHTAGIFADMSLDGPEIGTLVAVVDRAKNLPNRKTMGKQDPYCAMRLGKEAKKTDTDRRGGQTPRWDQELRFTVHDCPDYYKLKCSIFNDDKKTDLIGEAWIDLKDLIVPGGGQNDLWHQLNFKGKYAGDIRMEMTYYDTRTDPDSQSDNRRQKESTHSNQNIAMGPRQLGPREIKRRPLPPGPGQPQVHDMPAPLNIQPRYSHPPPQQTHAHREYSNQPLTWMPPETMDDLGYSQPLQHERGPQQPFDELHDDFQQSHDTYNVTHEQSSFDYSGDSFVPLYESQVTQHGAPGTQPSWNDARQQDSPHSHPTSSPYTPYHSSPPVRQSPPSAPQDSLRATRPSTSATKYTAYRDSPLRQSISQQNVPFQNVPPDATFKELEAPPPPPAHRGSVPRPNESIPLGTPPQDRAPRQPHQKYNSIDDRSPLQMIEHQYSPHAPSSARSSARRMSHLSQQEHLQEKPLPEPGDVGAVVAGDFPAPHQLSPNYGIDFVSDPVEQDRQGRYIRRNSFAESQDFQHPPKRARTFDVADVFDERNTYRSEPRLVKPRAVSPNANQTLSRKSVSPHPHSRGDRSAMSGVPFGPNSYDVLNPGSSPSSNANPTPEMSRETARQKEVDKLRDQGPIIGNDGRVIDPSDHLPSDTWAPEPERKTRKPEHVIHIRRKDEPRQPRPGSSPMPFNPVSTSNSSFQSSPMSINPYSASNSPYQSSPDSTSAFASGRRNRLQKQMPQRPLPTQPYVHSNTSPAAIPQIRTSNQPSPSQQRNSMPSTPMSGPAPRPPLSEYQVPVGNSYNPRNSYHPQQHLPPTPTKMPHMPQRPQSYAYGARDDPLAAEMSMIDIGPSRGGGRTALRSNRGHSGY